VPSNSIGFCVAGTTNGRQLVGVQRLLRRPDALEQVVRRRRTVDLVDDHDVGEDRARAELEAILALVEDVDPDHVGRQQVRRALHARELQVEGARDRARERRLAHAREILDEDVPLGRHTHQHQVQEVAAHLDRIRDRQRHLAPQLLRAGDLLLADRAWFLPDALHAHCHRSLMP
jgi:hypothetical protein